jgi:hypothetical protein
MNAPSNLDPGPAEGVGSCTELRDLEPEISSRLWRGMTVDRLAACFVAIGVLARLVRYLVAFPMWPDEYQLAANFTDRGFLDLLRPLQNNQVAPVGFLWIELAVSRVFGFSEYSLRLFPLLSAVAGVFLFDRLAARLLAGVPRVFAVAIFAVAYYPIRFAGEIKPYSSDAFMALVLTWPAVRWWSARDETRWLWWLAVVSPFALLVSFPAVFVVGGISLGIAWSLWNDARLRPESTAVRAWVTFNLAAGAAFIGLLLMNFATQYNATQEAMVDCWADHFPPWQNPQQLVAWLAVTHTGEMFAYPVGAEAGGSILTSICVAVGLAAVWRSPRRALAVTVAGWFGMSLLAAALHRYPYGGHARLSQYLAPGICLLAGLGAALLTARLRRVEGRVAAARVALLFCALLGIGSAVKDSFKPYKSAADRDHRDFARRLWREATAPPTVCLQADLGVTAYERNLDSAYRCYHKMFAPPARGGPASIRQRVAAANEPFRCIAFHSVEAGLLPTAFEDWTHDMLMRYDLCRTEYHTLPLNVMSDGSSAYNFVRYNVYYFRPRTRSVVSDRRLEDRGPH